MNRQRQSMRAFACLTSLAAGVLFFVSTAQAAIVLQATRVIFNGADKEATMLVRNDGDDEALIQSWMAPTTGEEDTPFALVPPLARIPERSTQLLRILYEGSGLPTDRESVAWLHVQDVPHNPQSENVLQLAIRHAVKVFYRPRGLPGQAADAAPNLRWRLVQDAQGDAVEVSNPSLYHVSMVGIRLGDPAADGTVVDAHMIAPLTSHRFTLKSVPAGRALEVNFVSINDYGGDDAFQLTLTGAAAATGRPIVSKGP